jgi:hypothetical protein
MRGVVLGAAVAAALVLAGGAGAAPRGKSVGRPAHCELLAAAEAVGAAVPGDPWFRDPSLAPVPFCGVPALPAHLVRRRT